MLWGALGSSCYLGVSLVSHSANQDGLHHNGSRQHSMLTRTSFHMKRGRRRRRRKTEQSQYSRFHRLQNWGLEITDSSQWVPTHRSLYRTLSFWHTWNKHWGAFKMRAVQSLRSTKWLAGPCQSWCCSKSLGKTEVGRMFSEKGCSRISVIWAFDALGFPRHCDKD